MIITYMQRHEFDRDVYTLPSFLYVLLFPATPNTHPLTPLPPPLRRPAPPPRPPEWEEIIRRHGTQYAPPASLPPSLR